MLPLISISASRVAPVVRGRPMYTEGKLNCYRIPYGTTPRRKAFLIQMCPELRKHEFNLHAKKVSVID